MSYRISFLFLMVLLLFACAKPSVLFSTEEMLESGYSTYHKYAFLPTTDTQYAKMINRQVFAPALVQEARTQLEKKGFVLDTAHPDVLFTYHLVMKRKFDAGSEQQVVYNQQVYNSATIPTYNTYSGGSGISGGTYMRGGTGPNEDIYYFSSDNRPYTYNGKIMIDTLREGSMVIDMIDVKLKTVVWRSTAQGTKAEAEKLAPDEAVRQYLPAMLKKLPRKG
jgi:hypothetical protein